MTYEEYWHGDPWLVRDYVHAEEYRRESENYLAWWQGSYFAEAILGTISNAFLEKGAEPYKYPDRPHPITENELKKLKAEQEAEDLKRLDLWMKMFVEEGKSWGKKPIDEVPQG